LKVFKGGLRPGTTAFFQDLEKYAQLDVVLILDEVQSGYGRSGKFLHTNIIYQSRYNLFGKEWGTVFL
jgi:acetylornithine/succinyldiaminopimelate/putrescine aminotransferase